MTPSPEECLAATPTIDSDHPDVIQFALSHTQEGQSAKEKAVALFYAVREGWWYTPFEVSCDPEDYKASLQLKEEGGNCITKSILLAAAARAVGIPTALAFANVRNHLNSPKLAALMETDLFWYHGYVAFYLDGRWVKASSAFNQSLCEKAQVKTLEFDGEQDALLHEFDQQDRRHMEYVKDHGFFADFPAEEILSTFQRVYPKLVEYNAAKDQQADEFFSAGERKSA
ncbi:transglutaminase-like domain-containing protein [Rhodovibrionaceae bacterium A322]